MEMNLYENDKWKVTAHPDSLDVRYGDDRVRIDASLVSRGYSDGYGYSNRSWGNGGYSDEPEQISWGNNGKIRFSFLREMDVEIMPEGTNSLGLLAFFIVRGLCRKAVDKAERNKAIDDLLG